jgi:hypothetical protein
MKTWMLMASLALVVPVAGGADLAAADAGIEVTIESRVVVRKSEKRNWFPNVHRMANGNLLVTCQTAADETNPEGAELARHLLSLDNGRTWRELNVNAPSGASAITLRDGTFLRLWFYTLRAGHKWQTKVVRSLDNGLTYATEDSVPVSIEAVQEAAKQTGMAFDGGIVEMDDGELLATMYGYFQGDKKYRCVLVRSRDRGHSWRYVATIAYDATAPGEGLCEPAMIRTGGAGLLVAMRTGSMPGKTPMYSTRSADAGLTWSKPIPIADRGVEPDFARTEDNVLVCSYGRPNVYVMCSPDGEGRRWIANTPVYLGSSTCYTAMAAIGKDRILLVHDALGHKEPGDGRPYNYVFAVTLKVRRTTLPLDGT